MKKILSMVLLSVLCIGLCAGTAHADMLSQLIGFWEVQNIGLGGYAFGPSHVGVDEMTAVVEEDGVCIITMNGERMAGYLTTFGSSLSLVNGDFSLNMSYDSQGRLHIEFPTSDANFPLDVRMRKGEDPDRVDSSRLVKYLGTWELVRMEKTEREDAEADKTDEEAEEREIPEEMTMILYPDGYGVLMLDDELVALHTGLRGTKFCLIDEYGQMISVTEDEDGTISFTLPLGKYDCKLFMQPEQ